jgi:hypothetical protein
MKKWKVFFTVVMAFNFVVFGQISNGKVQAKSYTESTGRVHATDEPAAEGGTCLGWISNGTYAAYKHDFGSGANLFRISASSATSGGSIQIRIGSSSGTLLGTVQFSNTGSFKNYQTKETSIKSTSGVQDLYLVFKGGDGWLFNIAWFETLSSGNSSGLTTNPAPVSSGNQISSGKVQAKNYIKSTGRVHGTDDISQGGPCLGWITNGTYATYKHDFGSGANLFRISASSATSGGSIQIRIGSSSGTLLGTVQFSNTGSFKNYQTKETSIKSTSGVQDLYLVFKGGDGWLFNIAWFETLSSGNSSGLTTNPAPVASQPIVGNEIFNNGNKNMVYNGVKSNTYFYVGKTTTIKSISNYHWNNGRGSMPGKIGLRDTLGAILGEWQSVGSDGMRGVKNANWTVYPNITLQPGLYMITDSEPSTWSQNLGSFGAGFSIVNAE